MSRCSYTQVQNKNVTFNYSVELIGSTSSGKCTSDHLKDRYALRWEKQHFIAESWIRQNVDTRVGIHIFDSFVPIFCMKLYCIETRSRPRASSHRQ